MPSRATPKNFHVPLPPESYEELREAAESLKRPATQLARELIQSWLEKRKKLQLKRSITTWAAREAGTDFDLDTGIESAATEFLRKTETD